MESLALADVVRYARQRSGLSARRASELAGLSPSYVKKLEDGTIVDPGLRSFARLAQVLGMNQMEVFICVMLVGGRGTV